MKRTVAERRKLVEQICLEYSESNNTIASICEARGVDYSTFSLWVGTSLKDGTIDDVHPLLQARLKNTGYRQEYQELWKKCREQRTVYFSDKLKEAAKSSLLKKVQGFEIEETHTEVRQDAQGNQQPVSVKKVKKQVAPDTTAIIFALKNVDAENFKDRVHQDHSGELTVRKGLNDLSEAELLAMLAESKASIEDEGYGLKGNQ